MIIGASELLAPEMRALDEAFGLIDLPDNVIALAVPDRHIGHWRVYAWRLLLTAERVERQHRKAPATVRRDVMVSVDAIRGGFRADAAHRHATVQEIIDELATWAAGGLNTLDLGASA